MAKSPDISDQLDRLADALERLAPPPPKTPDFKKTTASIWDGEKLGFLPVKKVNTVPLDFLVGVDHQKQQLLENTKSFAEGYSANNALLWGARGMGKSSLIKAVHQQITKTDQKHPLVLIEITRDDIKTIDHCLEILNQQKERFILFCDDLSFEPEDKSYKSLKALLEGGIAGRPENVIFYASSNQRHLLPRQHSEYDSRSYINDSDITNETISLSDRFGLWLGFHNCSEEDYRDMVVNYAVHYKIPLVREDLLRDAHQWQMARGSRSGRVAWQFIQHQLGIHHIRPE